MNRTELLSSVGSDANTVIASYDKHKESLKLADEVRQALLSTAAVEVCGFIYSYFWHFKKTKYIMLLFQKKTVSFLFVKKKNVSFLSCFFYLCCCVDWCYWHWWYFGCITS